MPDINTIWKTSKNIMKFTSPLTWLVVEATEKAIGKSNAVIEIGNIDEINKEAFRQEIISRMAKDQAKVAQEVAIARRIDTAEEVTIEEFYDTSGEGGIGLSSKDNNLSLGATGSGRHVTRRIYTFKGWRDGGLEVMDSLKETDR
ncbi:MAG TPA: hypothetical protein VIK72_09570 [Clostridiaceae bacterium]